MTSYLRHVVLSTSVIVLVNLLGVPLLSQTTDVPPGYINGAETPQLIPDSTAFRLVFISLRLPKSPSEADLKRQSSRLKNRIGLADADVVTVKEIMTQFGTSYDAWLAKYTQPGASTDVATATSEREAIVEETIASLIKRLSSEGVAQLSTFVQKAKVRMLVQK